MQTTLNFEPEKPAGMNYFLEDVASYLYNYTNGDLRNVLVVFPNRRARLFFNNYLSGLTDKPVWAPQYLTISDLVQQLSNLQLADQLTLLFKLFKVYKEVTASNETFDTFYYYCETILADFDDIDKYLVNASDLYQNLSDLKAIEDYYEYLSDVQVKAIMQFWEAFSGNRFSGEKSQFITIWEALRKIYQRFNEELDKDRLAYEGKLYRHALEMLETATSFPFDDKLVAFVGFNALNKAEEILFDRFKSAGKTLFFWDYDESYIRSDIQEAGYFLRKYLKKYPQPAGFKSPTFLSRPKGKITVVTAPANVSQAKLVNFCLEKLNVHNGNDPVNTALILADENLLLPVINSIPENIKKANISMGYPVIDTPAFSFISSVADMLISRRERKKQGGYLYYHKHFFSLMHHVYLETINRTSGFTTFEKECSDGNVIYVDPDSYSCDDPLYKLLFSPLGSPLQFGRYLLDMLQLIGKQILADDKQSRESEWHLEVLHSIHRLLVRFDAMLTESDLELSFQTVFSLFTRILTGISVPFSGEPLQGLQIMGILETRTLDFQNLIILSMNEGKFPKTGNVPSLIPFSLREGFGLPTVKHQDAIFAYYFYRLLHRSENVILGYNTFTEGLQKGEASRFIQQLRYGSSFAIEEVQSGYTLNALPKFSLFSSGTPFYIQKLEKYFRPEGKYFLSPSALNTYLYCKLRFFYRYIEGLKEPPEINEEVEANVFGSILHKTMEILYTDFKGKQVTSGEIEKIRKDKQRIEKAIRKAFALEYFGKEDPALVDFTGRNLIIEKVIEKYTHGLLEYDVRTAPLHIILLEKHVDTEVEIPGAKSKLALGGYIDRLDEVNGTVRVVDYKTGLRKSSFAGIGELFDPEAKNRNPAVFQTFLYSWIIARDKNYPRIQPSLFYVRDIFSTNFDYRIYQKVDRNSTLVENFASYETEFEERLQQLIIEIFSGKAVFTQTPIKEHCRNCPYNKICMRRE